MDSRDGITPFGAKPGAPGFFGFAAVFCACFLRLFLAPVADAR
jgi:hypothetical protein